MYIWISICVQYPPAPCFDMENAFLEKLTWITVTHLSDSEFGVKELAREMGLSYSSLRRRVSSYTGKSANQLIREIRLRKAFEMLQNEEVTTAEVAYRTGFSSPNYFNSCFHEYFGYPPGKLRKNGSDEHEIADGSKNKKVINGAGNIRNLMRKVGIRGIKITGLVIIVILVGIWHLAGINWGAGEKAGETTEKTVDDPTYQYFNQGDFFADPMLFQPAKALESYREAVRLKPNLAEAYIGIATVLNRLYSDIESRSDSMLQETDECLKYADLINPGLYRIHEQRALWHGHRGDFNQALAECSLALKGNPDSPESLYSTAGILMRQGQWTTAKECLLRVIEKNFFSAHHFGQLAVIHEHLREFPSARQHFKEVMGLYPVNGPAIYGLVGISLKMEGDPAKARALFDTLIPNGYPDGADSLRLYYQRAMIDLYDGRYQDALDQLSGWQQAIPPGPPWYCRPKYLVMAQLYGLMRKPDLERQYYDSTRIFLINLQERSVENWNDPRVWGALGIAWAGLGTTGKALACAEKATGLLSLKPDAYLGPYAMEDVAYIYARIGRQQDASNILKKLLAGPGPLTPKMLELDPRWRVLGNLSEFMD